MGMKYLIEMIEQEHGKNAFYKMSTEEQLRHILEYAKNTLGAIEFIRDFKGKQTA